MHPARGLHICQKSGGEHSEEGEDQATDESSIHSHGQQRLKVLSVDFLEK